MWIMKVKWRKVISQRCKETIWMNNLEQSFSDRKKCHFFRVFPSQSWSSQIEKDKVIDFFIWLLTQFRFLHFRFYQIRSYIKSSSKLPMKFEVSFPSNQSMWHIYKPFYQISFSNARSLLKFKLFRKLKVYSWKGLTVQSLPHPLETCQKEFL